MGDIKPVEPYLAALKVATLKLNWWTRLCNDYRRVNAVTVRKFYPLPRMFERIDSYGDSLMFSTHQAN